MVTIPTVTQVIADKIPLIGGFFSGLIKRFLQLLTIKVDFETKVKLQVVDSEMQNFSINSLAKIERLKQTINITLWSGFGIVGLPFVIVFFFSLWAFVITFWILV